MPRLSAEEFARRCHRFGVDPDDENAPQKLNRACALARQKRFRESKALQPKRDSDCNALSRFVTLCEKKPNDVSPQSVTPKALQGGSIESSLSFSFLSSLEKTQEDRSPSTALVVAEPNRPPAPSAFRYPPNAFELFWAAYPRKVGKGAARKAFEKVNRKVEFGELLEGLHRYRFSPDEQYCPHPTTWLNQERWSDVQGYRPNNVVQLTGEQYERRQSAETGRVMADAVAEIRRRNGGRSPLDDMLSKVRESERLRDGGARPAIGVQQRRSNP